MTVAEERGPEGARETRRHRKRVSQPQASQALDRAVGPDGTGEEAHPAAEIAHHTRGRVRLRIPAAKQNPDLLEQIKAAFTGFPGIDSIETRPSSGSVILYYDPEHHADVPSLFQSLQGPLGNPTTASLIEATRRSAPQNRVTEIDKEIEDEAEFLAEHSTFAKAIVEFAKDLDRHIKRATNNNIDLKILVPIGLAGFTFLEIGAAAATPMWVTLVIFSLNHFVELHAHDDNDET